MTRIRVRGLNKFLLLSIAAPMVLACSGGSTDPEPPGGGGGEIQFASAVATPKSATIAKGGTATTTVVYSASANLTISSNNIQSQQTGITINQTSNQGSGNNYTRAYSITPDATVPVGTHIVRFWIGVNNATSTVTTTVAEFSLTVN